MNNFKFIGLDHLEFGYLNELSEPELSVLNITKMTVDKFPGFPCRITLEDAEVGEEVFLFNYNYHQPILLIKAMVLFLSEKIK